jgi:hypothetical protein
MEILTMTYTLAMATEKAGIQTAEDGVVWAPMTDARALLTGLIREVRYGGKSGAFTERGVRQAYLVTPDFYEQAQRNAALLAELRQRSHSTDVEDPARMAVARVLHEELEAAERRIPES